MIHCVDTVEFIAFPNMFSFVCKFELLWDKQVNVNVSFAEAQLSICRHEIYISIICSVHGSVSTCKAIAMMYNIVNIKVEYGRFCSDFHFSKYVSFAVCKLSSLGVNKVAYEKWKPYRDSLNHYWYICSWVEQHWSEALARARIAYHIYIDISVL
jgi:hypothetical protein